MNIINLLQKNPMIYAVSSTDALINAANGKSDVIFLLKSDISQLKKSVMYAHDRGKKIFVHIDLTDGLGKDEYAVKFLADFIKPDGIISTKSSIIRAAKQKGLLTVFRVFLVDSQGVNTALATIAKTDCDFVEIMPGVIPSMIERFLPLNKYLIAGGLISTHKQVDDALSAGAIAVSTTNKTLLES